MSTIGPQNTYPCVNGGCKDTVHFSLRLAPIPTPGGVVSTQVKVEILRGDPRGRVTVQELSLWVREGESVTFT